MNDSIFSILHRRSVLAWLCLAGLIPAATGQPASGIAVQVGAGGFAVYDAASKKRIDFDGGPGWQPGGDLSREGGSARLSAEKRGEIRVEAEFSNHGGYILVRGELTNLQPRDRGVILDYRVPFAGGNLTFGGDLDRSVKISDSDTEENVYPIAAMAGRDGALAIAIPPTAPCEFGMLGGPTGLAVRYYLGLSPDTRNFPNRAPFAFIVYPVNPAWTFRSALSRYYSFFPDYYTNRSGIDGQCISTTEDGKEPDPPDISRYGFCSVETQAPWLQANLDRDKRNGILSLPYMIVGMREIKFLKTLPNTYAEAMDAYAHWSLPDEAGYPITKENEAGGRDVHLRAQVDSSVCIGADGRREIEIRHTAWGLNSVTFKTNPNPDLFSDSPTHTVGRDAIDLILEWCRKYPEVEGATIDSLGGNWPANFNYRRDHFRYARYPLTCDPTGRVAIHNEISHYEFLETLRAELRAKEGPNRSFIAANGIYSYAIRPNRPPQHYRTSTRDNPVWVGRFFLASLLDFAVSEPGISTTDESLEFMRASMGRKIYSPTNARWDDPEKVRRWVNRCLCYAFFGVNTRRYGDVIRHYIPDGYRRDQDLFDWFIPKVRLLSRAGWQPVTYSNANRTDVRVERYGNGDRVYFAVMSEAAQQEPCSLSIDLESLGFKADEYPRRWTVDEIAQGAPLRLIGPNTVSFQLKPYQTCIIALRKSKS